MYSKFLIFCIGAIWTLQISCKPEDIVVADPNAAPEIAVEWLIEQTLDGGKFFRDVAFSDELHGLTIGTSQMFYKTRDGGNTWTQATFPPVMNGIATDGLYSIYANKDFIIVGGRSVNNFNFMARSTDHGETWTKVSTFMSNVPQSIDFNGKNGVAVGNFNFVWTSSDFGMTWIESTIKLKSSDLTKVVFTDAEHCFVAGKLSNFFSNDQGATWQNWNQTSDGKGFDNLHMVDSKIGYYSDQNGLNKTTDGGLTWNYIAKIKEGAFVGFGNYMIGENKYLCYRNNEVPKQIIYSNDGGNTFSPRQLAQPNSTFPLAGDFWHNYTMHGDYFYCFPGSAGSSNLVRIKVK